MADILSKSGIYFDEVNKIRVLEPKIYDQANELREECKTFVEKIDNFQNLTDGFIKMIDTVANQVEKEKLKAIGKKNMLHSITKQKESKQLQLQALIIEKTMELERARIENQSLQRTQAEQQDLIEQLAHLS